MIAGCPANRLGDRGVSGGTVRRGEEVAEELLRAQRARSDLDETQSRSTGQDTSTTQTQDLAPFRRAGAREAA